MTAALIFVFLLLFSEFRILTFPSGLISCLLALALCLLLAETRLLFLHVLLTRQFRGAAIFFQDVSMQQRYFSWGACLPAKSAQGNARIGVF
ncbi:MAG: hypothetical protein CVV17_02685 [Gammaproteobacteria bacterium HGW-Gammaproteobacteria-7]|nr:MAG: hypothetical protein CVV17_02685 [Gammaproteobacteria bacterium HGW-Gammaproteobacteria-7]